VTSRTYLSIGDVLTLLREEFPDVTISKIRFLESQGLVNPERSPSGYRKFFETDVERLRWVLRQQREHFLPLKVIRDRLADGDLGEEEGAPSETARQGNGRVPEPAHAGAGARGASSGSSGSGGRVPGGGGGGTSTVTAPPPSHEPSHEHSLEQSQAGDEAMARILADASRRTARVPEAVDPRHSLHAIPDPSAPAPPTAGADGAHTADAADAVGGALDSRLPARAAAAAPSRAAAPAAAPVPVAPAPAAASHAASTVRTPRHAPAGAGAGATVEAPSPASPGPGPVATGRDHAALVEDDAPVGASGAAGNARATGTGGRAAAGRQGAAGPRAGEPGAAAPRERGAVGASGKSAGSHSTRNAAAPSQPPAAAPAPPAAKAAPPAAAAPAESAGPAGPAGLASGMVTGASLTAEELCAASGLSEAELTGLQGFGLIEAFMVAGIPTFDEDALTVANLAADFRKYGIEARHLRPYRNAVDREMGLIEQVIIPLLRQRNPESRQRAVEAADELGALGQAMRATLMRAALRRHVGG